MKNTLLTLAFITLGKMLLSQGSSQTTFDSNYTEVNHSTVIERANSCDSLDNYYLTPTNTCGRYYYNNYNNNGMFNVWDFGDGDTAHTKNGYHDYTSNGTYYTSLTIGNCVFYDTITVSCFATNSCDSLDNYYLTPTNTCGRYYYNNYNNNGMFNVWDFGDGDTAHTKNGYHDYTSNGTYYTSLTIGNCVFYDTITVSCYQTNIDESNSIIEMDLYPNPSSDKLNIKFQSNLSAHIEIYNYSGKLINSTDLFNKEFISIDVAEYKTGIYFIKITDLDNQSFVVNKFFKI